jgi:CubicO group peptidase (beta-lactamase class C family)
MKIKMLSILLIVILPLLATAQSVQKQVKILDNFIQEAIDEWNPPGLVVAVVKDGEVVFSKGYGTMTIGEDKPVQTNTLFMIGSTTKAFIAASLAMMVDEGKLDWDDHVIDYLPSFQLYDPYVTREITIRDLLTHRTGMGNTDFLWSWMTISGDRALYKMRNVEPAYSLRASFIYQNLMYLAAGKVLEKVSGKTWTSFLQERIYQPLGMKDSYPTFAMVKGKLNKADAHVKYEDEIIKINQLVADEIGPAGSMWASIDDMSKWVKFLLDKGQVNGDTLISAQNFNELFKPQQIVPAAAFYPTQMLTQPHWTTYGFGWFQHDYRGKMVQFHTGSLPGMVAIIGMIPEKNIGVYVMANLDHVELRHAIMYTTFDLFMDGRITTDWSKDLKELYDKLGNANEPQEPKRVNDTKPSIQNIAGVYQNNIFGRVEITGDGSNLHFNLNNTVKGNLEWWHYDTYQVSFDEKWYPKSMVSFRMDTAGEISYLEIFGRQFDVVTPRK